MNKILKSLNWLSGVYIWVTILIFIITIYSFLSRKNRFEPYNGLEEFKGKEVRGLVINKYKKTRDRGAIFLQLLSHDDTVNLTNYYINLMLSEKLIEIGDSLLKKSGKMEFEVYKKGKPDSLIIITNEDYKIIDK